MKTSLLCLGALLVPALACEKSQVSHLGQAQSHVIASLQADKAPSKQPAPASPAAPAKKPAPKEREPRPVLPPHLFM